MEKNIKEILNRIRKINKKINKSNFSRKEGDYKKLLKPKTIKAIEINFGNEMKELGYL